MTKFPHRGGMAESRLELTFSDPGAGAATRHITKYKIQNTKKYIIIKI